MSVHSGAKAIIYGRDKGMCALCGKPVSFQQMTVDHVHPKVLGGGDEITNICVAHHDCNVKKNAQVPDPTFVKMIKRRTKRFFQSVAAHGRKLPYAQNFPIKPATTAEVVVSEPVVKPKPAKMIRRPEPGARQWFEVGA